MVAGNQKLLLGLIKIDIAGNHWSNYSVSIWTRSQFAHMLTQLNYQRVFDFARNFIKQFNFTSCRAAHNCSRRKVIQEIHADKIIQSVLNLHYWLVQVYFVRCHRNNLWLVPFVIVGWRSGTRIWNFIQNNAVGPARRQVLIVGN